MVRVALCLYQAIEANKPELVRRTLDVLTSIDFDSLLHGGGDPDAQATLANSSLGLSLQVLSPHFATATARGRGAAIDVCTYAALIPPGRFGVP